MHVESSLLRFIKEMKTMKGKKGGKPMMGGGGSGAGGLGSLLRDKASFLAMVFGTLVFQLCLVALTIKSIPADSAFAHSIRAFTLMIFLVQLAIVVMIAFVPMPVVAKFFLFTMFSVLTGLMLNSVVKATSKRIVYTAIVGTMVFFIMFGLLGVACAAMGIELGMLGIVLFLALFGLVVMNVVYLFMKESAQMTRILATLALIVFGGYIAYDTNAILQRDYMGDFVTAALDYFLDVINVFLNLIRLMDSVD